MFDISYFRNNPLPFYTLVKKLYPGKYRPTISHSFVRLLSDKGLLLKLFTQNIDCLDRQAGVPEDKIVEAHGSFATHRCIECKSPYPNDLMKRAVSKAEVPHCLTPQCNGLVKPDIVFFGEALPENFHKHRSLPSNADLCIVIGTSLSVQPFASLPSFCSEGVPRVLINLDRVGELGSRADDVLILGDCDAGVRKLATALGWQDELETLWNATKPEMQDSNRDQHVAWKTKDERLDDQIASLTEEVDKSLQISSDHDAKVRDQLAKGNQKESRLDARALAETGSSRPTSIERSETHNKGWSRATGLSPMADVETDQLQHTSIEPSQATIESNWDTTSSESS